MVGAELEEFRQYLAGIGMGAALVDRAEEVLESIKRSLPEEPQYVFVSEYRDEEGNRNHEGLWVFSENLISEAELVTQSEFDLVRVNRGFARVVISREDFDFEDPKESSRLRVEVDVSSSWHGLTGVFKASGSNCEHLQRILDDYLIPRLTAAVSGD